MVLNVGIRLDQDKTKLKLSCGVTILSYGHNDSVLKTPMFLCKYPILGIIYAYGLSNEVNKLQLFISFDFSSLDYPKVINIPYLSY